MSLSLHPIFAEEGLPAAPVPLFSIGDFQVNNSEISAVVATIVVITVVQIAMRAPKLVPDGLQNLTEFIVESLSSFIESITGRETMLRGFWFFGGLFVFLFAENVLALFPGTGTIGIGHGDQWYNLMIDKPFLRGANANANMTAAYAAIFFFMWFYWCFRAIGAKGVFKDIFASKVQFKNIGLNLGFGVLFFIVGLLEVLTIVFIRPIAFTFRLYGNIYGGESFLDTIYRTAPNYFLKVLFLIPAYMWEFVVAFIQAFVFFILTVVFTGILTNATAHGPGGDHGDSKDGH